MSFNFDIEVNHKNDVLKSIDDYKTKIMERRKLIGEYRAKLHKYAIIIQMVLQERGFFIINLNQYYELLYSKDYTKKKFNFGASYYNTKRNTRVNKKEELMFYIDESISLKKGKNAPKIKVYIKFHLIENIMSILEFKFDTDDEDEKIEIFKIFNTLNRKTYETTSVPIKKNGAIVGYETVKNYIQIYVYNMKKEEENMLVKCRDLEYIKDYTTYDLLNNIII